MKEFQFLPDSKTIKNFSSTKNNLEKEAIKDLYSHQCWSEEKRSGSEAQK